MKKNISVLIVEDELYSAMYLKEILLLHNFIICDMVATGEEAVTAANDKKPDIILMDIRLAGEINGIEAAGRICQNNKTPVIFITGYAGKEIFDEAQTLKPLAFLIKPVDISDLVSKINSAFTE